MIVFYLQKKNQWHKKKYQERLTSPCIHMRSSILTILNTSETTLQKNICFIKRCLFFFKDLHNKKIKHKELLSNKSLVITNNPILKAAFSLEIHYTLI